MKYLLFFLSFFICQYSFACVCNRVSLLDQVARADFIAKAEIISITPRPGDPEIHEVEIKIIELYKGEKTKMLVVYSALNSSCAFYPGKNTNWLIFATKGQDGKPGFGYCSGSIHLDRKFVAALHPDWEQKYIDSYELKLQVIEFLKLKKIEPVNEYALGTGISNKCLADFRGINIGPGRFALFELTIRPDLTIKKVRALKKFDNRSIKKDLNDCIKHGAEVYGLKERLSSIPETTKLLMGLYYYPPEQGNHGFIGEFAL